MARRMKKSKTRSDKHSKEEKIPLFMRFLNTKFDKAEDVMNFLDFVRDSFDKDGLMATPSILPEIVDHPQLKAHKEYLLESSFPNWKACIKRIKNRFEVLLEMAKGEHEYYKIGKESINIGVISESDRGVLKDINDWYYLYSEEILPTLPSLSFGDGTVEVLQKATVRLIKFHRRLDADLSELDTTTFYLTRDIICFIEDNRDILWKVQRCHWKNCPEGSPYFIAYRTAQSGRYFCPDTDHARQFDNEEKKKMRLRKNT